MNRRGDIEPSLYTLLTVIIAAGILLLIIYATQSMFHLKISFG